MTKVARTQSLEHRVFVIIVMATTLYMVINLVLEFFSGGTQSVLFILYSIVLTICLFLVYLIFRNKVRTYHINTFAVFLFAMFVYYIPKSFGPTGGVGYTLQNMIVILLFMTSGRMQTFLTLALTGLTLVLFTDVLIFEGKLNYLQLVIDYGVNLVFMAGFMVIFKNIFDTEREKLIQNNAKIEEMNVQLTQQSVDLQKTNEEIQQIRDNLQEKILERTKELEEENQKLIEYSFINAHLIRAPLTNISGALQLKSDDPKLKELEEGIHEMDEVIKKIALVLK